MSTLDRVAALAAGGVVATYAARRRDLSGLALGVLAGVLVERALDGGSHDNDDAPSRSAPPDRDWEPEQQHGRAATVDASKAQKVNRAVTIVGREPEELYEYWRHLENLPRIMSHLEEVTVIDSQRSHWKAKAPAGFTVEWDAEIVAEAPGERIAWKSVAGASIPNAGSVNFRRVPGGRGTEVRVSLEYEAPGGKLGATLAKLFGEEPLVQVREDLRRYKQLMEAGEIPVSENPGQGARARTQFDAKVGAGATGAADVRALQEHAVRTAHQPHHVPLPADVARGSNTTGQLKTQEAHS